MVFFVCEGCNETLKKNKVNTHAGCCRNCWAVSCVDCSIVFEGNDYAAHTSCLSEAEKYEKSLFQGDKNKSSKKKTPQERWMDIVQSASCLEDRKVQDVLTRIASYDNVPRKKNKFVNFVSNSLALRDMTLVEKAWMIYEIAFKASVIENANPNVNSTIAEETGSNNKRPTEIANDETVRKKSKTENKPIKWSKLIKSALKNAGKELEMATLRDQVVKHIQKKVLSTKKETELTKEFEAVIRESDKFAVAEVVRLN